MLPSVSSFNDQLKTLPPSMDSHQAATNFINTVAAFINQVQPGPSGSPGILTYTKPPAIAMIEVLPPTLSNSWIVPFSNAIHIGVTTGVLVQGHAVAPAWTASGGSDVLTPVITTLAPALAVLQSGLANVNYSSNPPMPLAQAISDYVKAFTFLCTGLVLAPPGAPVPLPLPFTAQ